MAKLIPFTCPGCGKNLTASSSERDTRCEHCGRAIHLTDQPDPLAGAYAIPIPSQVRIEHIDGLFRIRYVWFKPAYLWVLLFSILWNGVMLPMLFTAIQNPHFLKNGFSIIPFIPLPVIGILMLGWAVIHLFNRTVIEIAGDELSVRFAPFPWFGQMKVNPNDLQKLVCSRSVVETGRWQRFRQAIPYSYIEHEIYAYRKSSPEEFRLLANLPSTEVSYFIKHMIELQLKIE